MGRAARGFGARLTFTPGGANAAPAGGAELTPRKRLNFDPVTCDCLAQDDTAVYIGANWPLSHPYPRFKIVGFALGKTLSSFRRPRASKKKGLIS